MEKLCANEHLDEEFFEGACAAVDDLGNNSVQADPERDAADPNNLPESEPGALQAVLNFNYDMLPPAFAEFVRDTSHREDVPPEFVAGPLLVGFSALVGTSIQIRPKKHDDMCLVPRLSGLLVAPSGRLRGPKMRAALRPLYGQKQQKRERIQIGSGESEARTFDFERLLIEPSHSFSRGKVRRVSKTETGSIESICAIENSFQMSSPLADIENLNLMTSIVEGELPDIIGKKGNLELLNQFDLAFYPDFHPWEFVDESPNLNIIKGINSIFAGIDKSIKNQRKNPVILRFSDDAQDFSYAWLKRHMPSLEVSNNHPALVNHLSQYKNLFPTLSLLFYLCENVETLDSISCDSRVDLLAATRALGFLEILDSHARRIYGIVARPEISLAKIILEKIRQGRLESPFAARDVCKNGGSDLKTAAQVKKPLDLLVKEGYLDVEMQPKKPGGGASAKRFVVKQKE